MEANKILDADILDIIFDGKNKILRRLRIKKIIQFTVNKGITLYRRFAVVDIFGFCICQHHG